MSPRPSLFRLVQTVYLVAHVPFVPLAGQYPSAELSTAAIAQRAIPATVTIVAFGERGDKLGQGSGFLVRPTGVVLTNWHVVQGAFHALVILADGREERNVRYLASDSIADLAVLKIPGVNLPSLPIADEIPRTGNRVIAVGSPLGFSQTVTDGIVSATRNVGGLTYVQITAAISPGSSGGPLLDGSGQVFAVTTSTMENAQALNFAVPIRYARPLLRAGVLSRPLAETTGRSLSPHMLEGERSDASQPAFISVYEGTVTNAGLPDWPATLHIAFEGWSPSPHGYLLIGSPLGGSGPVTAGWIGDSVGMMTVAETGDSIFWIGGVSGDQIRGTYRLIGGQWTGQSGVWAVRLRSGQFLPRRRQRP